MDSKYPVHVKLYLYVVGWYRLEPMREELL